MTSDETPSRSPERPTRPDPVVQAALSERVDDDEALAMSEAASSEIGQLRRDVAQLTETVAMLLDMQQGSPVPRRVPMVERGKAAVSSVADAARAQGSDAFQKGQDALQRGQEAVGALGVTLERQIGTLTRDVSEMAERNPLGTVLGALGLGFVVGALLRRR